MSPKREDEGVNSGIEKLDLECPSFARPLLANELVEARFSHDAVTLRVSVYAVMLERGLPIERHAIPYRRVRV